MPEIKHGFTQGKMNKDLDERLVPNGQYRDAMNVQVTTSEGSDVGTVQNILGNKSVESVVPSGFKCIGSIADEKNNRLYWFVTSNNIDAILEYEKDKIAVPVIVDTKAGTSEAVLKFTSNIITGINIIDNLLLWTDNTNEPRKINIDRCKMGTLLPDGRPPTSLSVSPHTKLVVDDIIATDKFTVISNNDIVNLTEIDLIDTSELTTGMTLVSIAGVDQTGITISSVDSSTEITLSEQVDVTDQDEIIFSSPIDIIEDNITVIKKKPIVAPTVKIIAELDKNKPSLFEKTFCRFACRYKYEDGEYSSFGPFTDVVFDSRYMEGYDKDTIFSTKEPYNAAMLNSIKSIELTDFIPTTIPNDVIQVDILYKQEDSPVVYSIANIKPSDPEWTSEGSNQESNFTSNYKGKYTVESENIYAALPSNQTLRLWDNVPRKALAQEITGNRVVYGNYTQNYDLGVDLNKNIIKPSLTAGYNLRNNISDFNTSGLPSIKSQRNYQLGVVFGDAYGRETPVFTSTNAAVNIPWNSDVGKSASNSLQLVANLTSSAPAWSDYYKFFIKETAGEYYNLIMDKSYTPTVDSEDEEDINHLWISFPSTDRNKITEETYLILKKKIGVEETQIQVENRFKVLDIKNEAPDSIKYRFTNIGSVDNDSSDILTDATSGIFHESDKRIDKEVDTIVLEKESWLDNDGAPLVNFDDYVPHSNHDVSQLYLSWQQTGGGTNESSKRYRVVQASTNNTESEPYTIKLTEKISAKDAAIAGGATDLDNNLTFKIERKDLKDMDEFSGRFFVKIATNELTSANIENNVVTELLDDHITSIQQDTYWFMDTQTSDNDHNSGITNTYNFGTTPDLTASEYLDSLAAGTGTAITSTASQWQYLETNRRGTFFIDNMYFCGGQNSSESYAKDAGSIVRGTAEQYTSILWTNKTYPGVGSGFFSFFSGPHRWYPYDYDNRMFGWMGGSGYYPILFPNTIITDDDPNNTVNGMEGVITTNSTHTGTNGIRRWRKEGPLATIGRENPDYSFDQTYGPDDGKDRHFIHLSFLAPGSDLVPDSINLSTSTTLQGENSLAGHLQGIWGGGVFCKPDGSDFGISYQRIVEMEGNYNGNTPLEDTPGPGIGQGYNTAYAELHNNQWNPAYPASGDPDGKIQNFISSIHVGNKFKFSGDSSDTVYTILSKSIKRIYNHTPWRRRRIYDDGTNTWGFAGDSVEEAAITWGDNADSSGTVTVNTNNAALENKIKEFGYADNRRVCYIIEVDKNPATQSFSPIAGGGSGVDANTPTKIQFIETDPGTLSGTVSNQSAIWETEPTKSSDLDIYYEASGNIPTKINKNTREVFAPIGCRVEFVNFPEAKIGDEVITGDVYLESWDSDTEITVNTGFNWRDTNANLLDYSDRYLRFYRKDGSYTTAIISSKEIADNLDPNFAPFYAATYRTKFIIESIIDPALKTGLSWYNCFSFGNGLESNRIRDGFNEMKLSNGARASATIEETYKEENRKHGLIYSGLYNSNFGLNDLNQFIMADKITKDLNPTFGSIQKLFQRRAGLITFCEDRVLNILSNRDALYNADGNPQLISSSAVLGDATPFVGDYGISKNPESFAKESYRAYFTDKQRGAVLRLSKDGLTPISDAGMHDWFRDNLTTSGYLIGTYDEYKKDYNLTLTEPIASNLLINAEALEGEEVSENVPSTELIIDGNMNTGISFVMPTVIAPEDDYPNPLGAYANTPSSFWMDIDNEELNSTTNLINHPMIPAESLQVEVPGTVVVFPQEFYSFTSTPLYLFAADFDSAPADSDYSHAPFDIDGHAVRSITNVETTISTDGYTPASITPATNDDGDPSIPAQTFTDTDFRVRFTRNVSTGSHAVSEPFPWGSYVTQLTSYAIFDANVSQPSAGNIWYNVGNVYYNTYRQGNQPSPRTGADNLGIIFHHRDSAARVDNLLGANNAANYNNDHNYFSLGTGGGNNWNAPASWSTCSWVGGPTYHPSFDSTSSAEGMYNASNTVTTADGTTLSSTYTSAKQNTIFNGEELEVGFWVYTPDTDNTNTDDSWHWGGLGTINPDYSGFKLILWNRDTDSLVWTGLLQASDTSKYAHYGTPSGVTQAYGDASTVGDGINYPNPNPIYQTGNVLASGSTEDGPFHENGGHLMGYQDSSVVKFGALGNDGNYILHRCYFKFGDGTLEEKALINDLEFRVVFYTGSSVRGSVHIVKDLWARKVWRLEKPSSPYSATGEHAVNPVPIHDIPAWTEVKYETTSGWMSNSAGVDLHALATTNFFTDTDTGTGNTHQYHVQNSDVTLAPIQVNYDYGHSGDPNKPLYISPPGFDVTTGTWTNGAISDLSSSYPLANPPNNVYVESFTGLDVPLNDKFSIDSTGNANGKAYITQDILGSPLVSGDWYLVDVYYDTLPTGNISVYGVLDPTAVNGTAGSGLTTGFVGEVYESDSGTSPIAKSIQLIQTTRTGAHYGSSGTDNVLRAIFKLNPNSHAVANNNLNSFQLEFNNFDGEITKIVVLNVSENSIGGTATYWDAPVDSLNQGVQNNSFHIPTLYWKNSKFNFDNAVASEVLSQTGPFVNTSAVGATTNDGYEFKFTIDNNTDTGSISGELECYVNSDLAGADHKGFYIDGIDAAGDYVARVNFDGTGGLDNQGAVISMSIEKDGAAYANTTITDTQGSDATTANKIAFLPSVNNFTGSVSNVSLIDQTNFFSGGTDNAWSFTGFDPDLYNYITFNPNDKKIYFNDAPVSLVNSTDPIQLAQYIPNVILEGEKYKVSFDYNISNGSLNGYYFNTQGKGFRLGPITGSSVSGLPMEFEIGDATIGTDFAGNDELKNTFVIFVESVDGGQTGVSGSISNITMLQHFPGFVPATVTYSEDVGGWVSFKSFILENGNSVAKKYFTIKDGRLFEHHVDLDIDGISLLDRNTFYGVHTPSTLTVLLNDEPSVVKIFNTLNYEGSQSKINKYVEELDNAQNESLTTLTSYNLSEKDGWYVDEIKTDKQLGTLSEFIEKEGKWFNYIRGDNSDINPSDFSFQGLGKVHSSS